MNLFSLENKNKLVSVMSFAFLNFVTIQLYGYIGLIFSFAIFIAIFNMVEMFSRGIYSLINLQALNSKEAIIDLHRRIDYLDKDIEDLIKKLEDNHGNV